MRTLERPHSRLVWLRLLWSDGGTETVVVKLPRLSPGDTAETLAKARKRLREEHAATLSLAARFGGPEGPRTIQPVALYEDVPALLTTAVRGESLRERIIRTGKWFPSKDTLGGLEGACAGAGRWLRQFQETTRREGELVAVGPIVEYLEKRLALLGEADPHGMAPNVQDEVRAGLRRLALDVSPSERGVSELHADYSLSNVLCTETGIVAADVPSTRTGSVLHDPSRFWHQLGLLRYHPAFRIGTVGLLRSAFLDGYQGQPLTTGALWRLYLIRHTVTHWVGRVKTLRPGLRERLYNAWVCRRHRIELLRLIREAPR